MAQTQQQQESGSLQKKKSSTNSNLLELLSAEFPKSEVKSRAGGFGKNLDYIDIPSTINRLNSVLEHKWDWEITASTLWEIGDSGIYMATITGRIIAEISGRTIVRSGVGADKDKDPDKAIKTADAEALKKAGHKYGIALYLWDEGKRDEIAEYRKLANASISALQGAVMASKGMEKEMLVETYGDLLKTRQGLLSILDGTA